MGDRFSHDAPVLITYMGETAVSEREDLQRKLIQLQKEKSAFQAQCDLFQEFIRMARAPQETEFLKKTLAKIVGISVELTGADSGSLFLLDSDGVVVDSILARGEVSSETRSAVIGSVLKKGLAGWAVHHQQIGLVEDTRNDDRWLVFRDQPYEIRSAMAIPIVSGEMVLGILTLMHSDPGHFKAEMVDLMRITANQLALVLENAYLFSKLNESFRSLGIAKKKIDLYSKALEAELDRGRRIQKDFLPRQLPSLSNWAVEAFFQPARQVSGDFYDMFMLPGGYVAITTGDVCDKGVGSALFMALFRSLIRIYSRQTLLHRDFRGRPASVTDGAAGREPAEPSVALRAIDRTNDYIAREHGEMSMFATIFFCVLNPDNGELFYVNGGHEPVFVLRSQGIEPLHRTGPAVGLAERQNFGIRQTSLHRGDILFAYTDGLTEARSGRDELFTRQRLESLLAKPSESAAQLLENITSELSVHIGEAALEDDITFLILERMGPSI
jgi:sigma-B regulation protein RsbU (phosphoserine phosphatase)